MSVTANQELAMILPVPSRRGAPDDAVKFISMEDYPNFFDHLATLFPEKKQSLLSPNFERHAA